MNTAFCFYGAIALTGLCFGRRPPFKPCIYKRLEVDQRAR